MSVEPLLSPEELVSPELLSPLELLLEPTSSYPSGHGLEPPPPLLPHAVKQANAPSATTTYCTLIRFRLIRPSSGVLVNYCVTE